MWDKIPAGGRGGDPRWDSFTSAGAPAEIAAIRRSSSLSAKLRAIENLGGFPGWVRAKPSSDKRPPAPEEKQERAANSSPTHNTFGSIILLILCNAGP
jgi:hypothetical protein